MRGILAALLIPVAFTQAIERLEPAVYFCNRPEQVLYKEPLNTTMPAGKLQFGMAVAVKVRHQDWLGLFTLDGIKGWAPAASLLPKAGFAQRYPHIALNEEGLKKLLQDATAAAPAKKNEAPAEILVRNKGETEEVYVRKDNVNIRSKPTVNSRVLRQTFQGEAFRLADMIRGWYRVEYDEGLFGWLSEECAWPDSSEHTISLNNDAGMPKAAGTYIMAEPRPDTRIVAKAKKERVYEILAEQEGWLHVRLDSLRTGWILDADFRVIRQGQKKRPVLFAPAAPLPAAPPPPPPPVPAPELALVLHTHTGFFKSPNPRLKPARIATAGEAFMIQRMSLEWARIALPGDDTVYAPLRAFGRTADLFGLFDRDARAVKRTVLSVALPAVPAICLYKGPSAKFAKAGIADEKDTLLACGAFGGYQYVVSTRLMGWACSGQLSSPPDLNRGPKGRALAPSLAARVQAAPKLTRTEFLDGMTAALPADLLPAPTSDSALIKTYLAEMESYRIHIRALLDSKTAEVAAETKKRDETDQRLLTARMDSMAADSQLLSRSTGELARLDSQRIALNIRFTFQKDSLAKERARLEQSKDAVALLAKLKEEQATLKGEINILKTRSKDSRERAMNLKALAAVEFDIDTSARAKDSLLRFASGCDSAVRDKELRAFRLEGDIATAGAIKPEEIPAKIAHIDSSDAALLPVQREAALALVQRQQNMEKAFAEARAQGAKASSEKLTGLRKERAALDAAVKQLIAANPDPNRLLEEKRLALKESLLSTVR
ncbi:MAG: SH3 domain-containing protein [Fibrobacterota bacterium]